MDGLKIKAIVQSALKKHKYALLILFIGVLLIIFPLKKSENTAIKHEVIMQEQQSILDMEERLSAILSIVRGAGDVRVMLTQAKGEETIYQTNGQNTMGEQSGNMRTDTVTVTDSERNESGLVRQVNPALYLGAVIVCQGADDPTVRLAIVDAVSNATGLGANKITVLKMK